MSGSLGHLHVSEMGYICAKYPEKALEIVKGSLNAVTPGSFVTIESTARGREGWYFEQCIRALNNQRAGMHLTKLDYRFFFFNWLQNPDDKLDPDGVEIDIKESEYFDKMEKTIGHPIAQEKRAFYSKKKETQGENMYSEYPTTPDEAFMKILEGTYYAGVMAKLRAKGQITSIPYQQSYDVHTAWDLGQNDQTAIWFFQIIGMKILLIDYYAAKDKLLGDHVNVIRDKSAEHNYRYGVHCLPHDAKQNNDQTGLRREDYLRKVGIGTIKIMPKLSKADSIENVRELLPSCWFDIEKCDQGIIGMEEYRKVWDKHLGSYRNEPLHNAASDPADAFSYLAVYVKYKQVREERRRSVTSKTQQIRSSAGWS